MTAADNHATASPENSPASGPVCSDDEWRAFVKMGQIREILAPRFAYLVSLARAEGLLNGLLADDPEAVQRLGSELMDTLAAQIHSQYQTSQSRTPNPAGKIETEISGNGEVRIEQR